MTISELAEEGSLYDLLHRENYQPNHEESLGWATQIAEGRHIHNNMLIVKLSGYILLHAAIVKPWACYNILVSFPGSHPAFCHWLKSLTPCLHNEAKMRLNCNAH